MARGDGGKKVFEPEADPHRRIAPRRHLADGVGDGFG